MFSVARRVPSHDITGSGLALGAAGLWLIHFIVMDNEALAAFAFPMMLAPTIVALARNTNGLLNLLHLVGCRRDWMIRASDSTEKDNVFRVFVGSLLLLVLPVAILLPETYGLAKHKKT